MMKFFKRIVVSLCLCLGFFNVTNDVSAQEFRLSYIGYGWAKNSVNAPVFRKNSVVSAGDYQFVAYYDSVGSVILAKRKHGTDNWEKHKTQYTGNVKDAHNMISIMADGKGFIHMSWDHHNHPLRYCRSIEPFGLEMGEKQMMTGENERVVTYPEFYQFDNGDLLFAYRDGGSGNGNLVLNRYHVKTGQWERLQTNLIDGQGQRNAYWQLFVDAQGAIHISWVWRETPNVATNHDMCYARSLDGGQTWQKSTGEPYQLPIVEANAEIVHHIPQNSNLINQTTMTADLDGNPYIATYYKGANDKATQFYVIYMADNKWNASAVTNRTLDFELGGVGSRSIPISRPQMVLMEKDGAKNLIIIYRDEEHDNFVCMAKARLDEQLEWEHHIISPFAVDRWEPSFDTELLKNKQQLHLYLQKVGQGQAETTVDLPAQAVYILEVN